MVFIERDASILLIRFVYSDETSESASSLLNTSHGGKLTNDREHRRPRLSAVFALVKLNLPFAAKQLLLSKPRCNNCS